MERRGKRGCWMRRREGGWRTEEEKGEGWGLESVREEEMDAEGG